MAEIPLATINRRLMTALRAMGYGDDILGPVDNVSPSVMTEAFLTQLRDMGIPQADIDTAKTLSQYKSGIGQNTPPPAPSGVSDITWRGVLQNYETSDRTQTMAENRPDTPAPGIPQDDRYGPKAGGAASASGTPQAAPAAPAQPAAQPAAGAGAGAGDKKNDLPTVFIPKSPQEITDFIHKNFGQDAWFMDIPEVSSILLKMASTGNTDGDEAIRQVSATQWYKGTDKDARQWYADERSDPGTTRAKIADQVTYLQGLAQNEGITIDPARLSSLAESSLRFNWKPSQIHAALSAEFKYDPTSTQQASVIGSMKSVASDYLVPLSDQALQSWDKGISTGDYTSAQFTEYVKSVSKSLFPQLSSAIDAGHTVQNYIDPYRQVAAQALDLAPQNIDFMNDPRFRSALEQIDPKTGMKTVMTLGDFQQKIKTDPQYGYDKTTAGINEGASLATQILQKFGKAT